MIRPPRSDERDAILALAGATGLFEPQELDVLGDTLAEYFDAGAGAGPSWLVLDDGNRLVATAYYAPEPMTEGTWNLYFIGVHPDHQGQGRGRALLGHVERDLAKRGQRLLIVETSGLPDFARTRDFYHKCGYTEEARIRGFYRAGDDKVVFCKSLNAASL
ncbi:MAG: GNAT family N-acetyltransferase [Myxococcota bacterium]